MMYCAFPGRQMLACLIMLTSSIERNYAISYVFKIYTLSIYYLKYYIPFLPLLFPTTLNSSVLIITLCVCATVCTARARVVISIYAFVSLLFLSLWNEISVKYFHWQHCVLFFVLYNMNLKSCSLCEYFFLNYLLTLLIIVLRTSLPLFCRVVLVCIHPFIYSAKEWYFLCEMSIIIITRRL